MGRYNGRVRTIHCKCVLIGVHCTLGGRFQKSFTIYCSYEEVQEEEKVGQSRLRLVFISFFAADSREGSFGLPNAFFFFVAAAVEVASRSSFSVALPHSNSADVVRLSRVELCEEEERIQDESIRSLLHPRRSSGQTSGSASAQKRHLDAYAAPAVAPSASVKLPDGQR